MPITINPQNPGNLIGPGLVVRAQSSLIGPLPTTTVWDFQINTPADEQLVYKCRILSQGNPTFLTLQIPNSAKQSETSPTIAVPENNSVTINVNVQEAGAGPADDTGTTTAVWSNTAGLTEMIKQTVGTQGGLTPELATQIDETWQSTAQVIAVDSTVPATGPGSLPGGVISAVMPVPIFGIIVRITQLPDDLVASTPDGDYFFPSLAVARIFRGSDLWMRVPVHTSSKMIPLFGDVITAAVATITAATWLAQMSYQVSFREGVAGTVTEMRFP